MAGRRGPVRGVGSLEADIRKFVMYLTPSPVSGGVDDLLPDRQVAVDVEVEQHEPTIGIVAGGRRCRT